MQGSGIAKKVVLVIDDDASIRDLIAKALSPKYDVRVAADGLAASEMLGAMTPPQLIISDVMMPNVDGFSLIRAIRSSQELQAVPIVFITAKTTPQSVIQGIQLGAKHYIQKPFSVKDLIEKVDKLLSPPEPGP
jgi:DNA-binding response OmpR family regulator